MITMPKVDSVFTILGIDPGSTFLGISIIIVNARTLEIISSKAWTINGAKLAGKDSWLEEMHGDRTSRIFAIEQELLRVFRIQQPTLVISESPFINQKFPASGIALTEVLCGIRRAVMMYDSWITLELVPPSNVKNALGCKGNVDKEGMLAKLITMQDTIKYVGNTPINLLDEHSIDALAVAYHKYIQISSGRKK